MAIFQPDSPPTSLLELFVQRHAQLQRVAESLTRNRREAEDLVQDAFVRLLLAQPDIGQIEHVDAYLRTMLRNLHMTRLRRRHVLVPERTLSIVDYDCAGFALTALSHALPLQARDSLRAVCRFVCARRLTSKTASIFLLHFFHEYVPAEIAIVARLRRQSIDTGLTRGRAEVRAYLEDPVAAAEAAGLGDLPVPEWHMDPDGADGADYVARLRSAIFALRHRRCYDTPFLARLYADHAGAVPTEVLAQLVTCPVCLDAVNRLTSLPVSADRHPFDAPRSTTRRRFGPAKGSDTQARARAARHGARVGRAHRPRLLRVLVNGLQVASHDVSGELTRATHVLSADAPHIAEICSEQGVYLATLQLGPVPGAPMLQQTATVLDDGRRLEIGVGFDTLLPTLRLSYEQPIDPAAAAVTAAGTAADDGAGESIDDVDWREAALQARGPAVEDAGIQPAMAWTRPPDAARPPSARVWTWTPRTWKSARTWASGSASAPASASASAPESASASAWAGPWTWPRLAGRYGAWAVVLVLAGWLLLFPPGAIVSAAGLVRDAIVHLWERWVAPPSTVPGVPPQARRHADIVLHDTARVPERPAASTLATPVLSAAAMTSLEVDALLALQRLHALAGQRIQVTRTKTGVAVSAILEDISEADLVRVLRALPNGHALTLALQTPTAIAAARSSSGVPAAAIVQTMPADSQAIPAAAEIFAHLRASSFTGDPAAEARRFANQGLRLSRAALLEALALERLAERYAEVSAAGASPGAMARWHVLLSTQAARVRGALAELRVRLEPVFAPAIAAATPVTPTTTATAIAPPAAATTTTTTTPATATAPPVPSAADRASATAGNDTKEAGGDVLRDARAIGGALVDTDRDIRAALAVAAAPPATTTRLTSRTFWERLRGIERSLTRFITPLGTP